MIRFTAIFIATSLVAILAIYGLARMQGLDLLAPQVRTIAALAVVTALYVGLRVAMVARRILARPEEDETGEAGASTTRGPKKKSAFSRWGRSSALDARLAARQARLDAARERLEAEKTASGKDSQSTSKPSS